jgi:hypothetical protein
VSIELNERSFAYWDVADTDWPVLLERLGEDRDRSAAALHRAEPGWYVDGGRYRILVGRSSADISAQVDIDVEGSGEPLPAGAPVG